MFSIGSASTISKTKSFVACFNVSTGDVEDAPALDPIAKFEVIEKDGAVLIRGDEASIRANRRKASHACKPSGKDELVVVGG